MGLSAVTPFHFLHPTWLAVLPVLLVLTVWLARSAAGDSAWARVMDPQLLSMLRMSEGHGGASPWWLVGTIWGLSALALAGPTWTRIPMPAYQTPAAWVLVFDLSPSMSRTDVRPDRTTRARYAANDLLSASHGSQVGLVVFAGEAHTVAPLTTDVATVRTLLNPLTPKLMPEDGDNLAPALSEAQRLLAASYARHGQVVVLSDGMSDPAAAFSAAERLRRSGATVNVVGIGTEAGSPTQGDELQRTATAGGGIYVPLSELHEIVERLESQQLAARAQSTPDSQLQQWQNEGVWLLVPILLLGTALARRGWV